MERRAERKWGGGELVKQERGGTVEKVVDEDGAF